MTGNDAGHFDGVAGRPETQDSVPGSLVGRHPATEERLPRVDLLGVDRQCESGCQQRADSEDSNAVSKSLHHFCPVLSPTISGTKRPILA